MTNLKGGIINTLVTISGLLMIEIVWAYEADYADWEIYFYRGLGVIITIIGLALFVYQAYIKKQKRMDITAIKEAESDNFFVKFRKDITSFFAAKVVSENMPLQFDCTQLYMNVIKLQKERLDKLGVFLKFHSMAKFGAYIYHKDESYYDGKYNIREIEQEIVAKKIFYKDKKAILIKDENEMAHYTLINAKREGDNQIICPNCGNVSSRENLIDGCDYCSTKFRVEDLDEKISNFTFRDSADLAYDKFKKSRMDKFENVSVILFFVFTLIVIAMFAIIMTDDGDASGDYFNPILFTLSLVVVAGVSGMLLSGIAMAGYIFVVMPLMEAVAYIKYNSKKRAEELKRSEENDKLLQKKIREYDGLFSIQGFYTNIHNKISSIIFSASAESMNIFTETDISKFYRQYQNVLEYDVQKMSLREYKVEDELQKADLEADLKIYFLEGQKVRERYERIQMRVVKSKDCKTQVIGAPQVIKCSGCGNSLSFVNGLICDCCGSKIDLKKYDWEISEFKVS